MRIKKIIAVLLTATLMLSAAACDGSGDEDTYSVADKTATGTNAPTVAIVDIKKAFTDMFTSVYGDFTVGMDYDMNFFNSSLGNNYSLLFHVTINADDPEKDESGNNMYLDDYYVGINRIGDDYCFEIIYYTAVEFLRCGNGYAVYESPEGLGWEHDDTLRTTYEHLKRVYNGLAYQIIAPYNAASSALTRMSTKATYLEKTCNLYKANYEVEENGDTYDCLGEYYIDEETGICMYSIVSADNNGSLTATTIECEKVELGTARLDYAPDPSEYL